MKRLLSLLLALMLALALCTGFAFASEGDELVIDWMPASLGDDPAAPEYGNVYVDPAAAYAEQYAAARAELERQLTEEGIPSDEIDLDAYLGEMMPMTAEQDDPAVTTPSTRQTNDTGATADSSHYYTEAADDIEVPDQGTRSICWAMAAMDCLRIREAMEGHKVPALDAEHLVYYSYHGFTDDLALTQRDYIDPIDEAGRGNVYASLMTLASWAGPSGTLDKDKDSSIYSDNALWLENGYWLALSGSADRAAVKQAVVEYGAVAASLYADATRLSPSSDYYNADACAYCYTGEAATTNHEIVIVGWDDDYSAANFKTKPTNAEGEALNGAWLCRNTWGGSWGDGGLFWVSYHDSGLTEKGVAVVFDAAVEPQGDHIYQYDGNYTFFSTEQADAADCIANVFTAGAEADHELLTAIGTYTTEADMAYTVSIYTALTDPDDPTSGHLVYTGEGELALSGYHSLALENPICLAAGTKFSVVFRFTPSDGTKIRIPVCADAKLSDLLAYNRSEAGESFRFTDDDWVDRSAKGVNYRIKAYTSADDETHTHAWKADTTLTAATCTTDGVTTALCDCGVVSTQAIPASHTLTHHAARAATAVVPGNLEYWECSACGLCFADEDAKTECSEKDVTLAALGFDDISASDFYYNEVLWAVENGITEGMNATEFQPDYVCTRAQIITFLWRAAGCPEPKSSECPFTDVKPSAYYYKPVLWAVEQGITKGMTATTFEPRYICTRGQIVTLLWRAAGSPAPEGKMPFTDATRAYYREAVIWAAEQGIAKGVTATTFVPEAQCSRWQAVLFLYRAYGE